MEDRLKIQKAVDRLKHWVLFNKIFRDKKSKALHLKRKKQISDTRSIYRIVSDSTVIAVKAI